MKSNEIKIQEHPNGNISVNANFELVRYTKENNVFLVICDELKLYGYSTENLQLAEESIQRKIDLFFKLHLKRKTLFDALKCLGWYKDEVEKTYSIKNNKIRTGIKSNKQLEFSI